MHDDSELTFGMSIYELKSQNVRYLSSQLTPQIYHTTCL